jgi:hypothetical protein
MIFLLKWSFIKSIPDGGQQPLLFGFLRQWLFGLLGIGLAGFQGLRVAVVAVVLVVAE